MAILPGDEAADRAGMADLLDLAASALEAYALGPARLSPIKPIENATFRVDAVSGGRYCLRMHPPNSRSAAEIRSELQWLAAIRRDTGLAVPEPVRAGDRALVTLTRAGGAGGPRQCVLFRWMEGQPPAEEDITPAVLARAGAFLARLHWHALAWSPPAGFRREAIDAALFASPRFVGRGVAAGFFLLEPGDEAVIRSTVARAREAMRALGEGADVFGLIHGDFIPSNWLLHAGELRVLDFEDCARGYYLYDIAMALRDLEGLPAPAASRAAFLDGYRAVWALPAEQEAVLDTFLAAAHVTRLLWVLQNAEAAAYREWAPRFVARSMARLRELAPA